jgi:post-segregation antitoxin (ccd killing protein)
LQKGSERIMRISAHKHIRVSLYLDEELVKRARDLGLNLSKVTENCLRRAVEALETPHSQKEEWTERDLNPRLPACEAGVHTTELSALLR